MKLFAANVLGLHISQKAQIVLAAGVLESWKGNLSSINTNKMQKQLPQLPAAAVCCWPPGATIIIICALHRHDGNTKLRRCCPELKRRSGTACPATPHDLGSWTSFGFLLSFVFYFIAVFAFVPLFVVSWVCMYVYVSLFVRACVCVSFPTKVTLSISKPCADLYRLLLPYWITQK